MIDFSKWLDEKEFPGNYIKEDDSLEFGDSAQRLGMMRLAEQFGGYTIFTKNYDSQIRAILKFDEDGKIEPTRHWDDSNWPGQLDTMSRDNSIPLLATSKLFAQIVGDRLKERFGKFWNIRNIAGEYKEPPSPDLALPTVWGTIYRTLGIKKEWLIVTDFFLLIQVLVRLITDRTNPEHTSDDLTTQVMLRQARNINPTKLSKLADHLYFKYGNKCDLKRYFRDRSKMTPPPIHKLYEDLTW